MITDSLTWIPTLKEPSLISTIRRITALAESIEDACYITVSLQATTYVTVACTTNDGARKLIASLCLPVRTVSHEGHTWLTATYHAAEIVLTIAGPHRKEEDK